MCVSETISRYDVELAELRSEHKTQIELIAQLEADLASAVGIKKDEDSEMSTMQVLGSLSDSTMREEDSSIFAIVKAQRDRLKQRIATLEEEQATEKTRQAILQTEIEKVREDNVKLYGRIKYLQSYEKKSTTIPLDTEGKYSEQYESRLDPFRKFNQTENQRSYTKLKLHDRASLSIGKAIMTSASARMTFFFYLLLLHLLVFLVLYRFAYSESCDRDFQQDCVRRFEQHMNENHRPGEKN